MVIYLGTEEQGTEHGSAHSTEEEDVHRLRSRPAREVVEVVNELLGYRLIEIDDLAAGYREAASEAIEMAESNLPAGFEALPEE